LIWYLCMFFFFFSSRRRHTRWPRDWSSDVCSSDLLALAEVGGIGLVATDLLSGHHQVEVRAEVAARGAEQLVVDVRDQPDLELRSEERRVGKECRSRW